MQAQVNEIGQGRAVMDEALMHQEKGNSTQSKKHSWAGKMYALFF